MFTVYSHHKCASTAMLHYLNDLAAMNNFDFYTSHLGNAHPDIDSGLIFLSNSFYNLHHYLADRKAIHFVRNPLDIVHSAYYSHLNTHSTDDWPELALQREFLKSTTKEIGMMKTAEFCLSSEFYFKTPGPLFSLKNWNFEDNRISTVRIEDFIDRFTDSIRSNIGSEFGNINWPDQANFSFEMLSGGRRRGDLNNFSHYRSGISGSRCNELSRNVVDFVRSELSTFISKFYPEDLLD
jgi:hypothetical protein